MVHILDIPGYLFGYDPHNKVWYPGIPEYIYPTKHVGVYSMVYTMDLPGYLPEYARVYNIP